MCYLLWWPFMCVNSWMFVLWLFWFVNVWICECLNLWMFVVWFFVFIMNVWLVWNNTIFFSIYDNRCHTCRILKANIIISNVFITFVLSCFPSWDFVKRFFKLVVHCRPTVISKFIVVRLRLFLISGMSQTPGCPAGRAKTCTISWL